MSRRIETAGLYAFFAALATAVNLLSQGASLALYRGTLSLPLAMGLGTATGLAIKYLLDKRWIFKDRSGGHMRKFSVYTLMGIFTTGLFWATELAFNALGPDLHLRFLGAALGLAMGYAAKYQLDRRFVFHTVRAAP